MQQKNANGGAPGGAEPDVLLSPPDISVLARYSLEDPANAHPDWMKAEYPEYLVAHAGHSSKTVREVVHEGHVIRITTTYEVEVDGVPVHTPLFVDDAGNVHTHATPFSSYASALDLMKGVVDTYPDSFAQAPAEGGQGEPHHGGHGGNGDGHGGHHG